MRDAHLPRLPENQRTFLEKLSISFEHSVNCGASGTLVSENLYLYCVSSHFSHTLARDFCGDMTPAILWITDVPLFFRALSECISNVAQPIGYARIQYVDGEFDVTRFGDVHPSLVKQSSYAYQHEIRMAWRPVGRVRKYLDVSCKKIKTYMILMRIDDLLPI
jgi:hypothetical protein